MNSKVAGGFVLVIVGVMMILFGLNHFSSAGALLGRQLGLVDSTPFVLMGGGFAIAAIGLVVALNKTGDPKRTIAIIAVVLALALIILFWPVLRERIPDSRDLGGIGRTAQ